MKFADVKIARIFNVFICLTNEPICNQKRSRIATKNGCSADCAGNKGDAPWSIKATQGRIALPKRFVRNVGRTPSIALTPS